MTDDVVFLYVTAPSAEVAEAIANRLVGDGIAACVNIFPAVASIYRWRGEVERSEECVAIIKCAQSAANRARAAIIASHPYETPSIACIPINKTASSADFVNWILENSAC
jgi:periplasmic divalent cation tolerance protein